MCVLLSGIGANYSCREVDVSDWAFDAKLEKTLQQVNMLELICLLLIHVAPPLMFTVDACSSALNVYR